MLVRRLLSHDETKRKRNNRDTIFFMRGIKLDNLNFNLQNRQSEYFRQEFQNLLPFFEQLDS